MGSWRIRSGKHHCDGDSRVATACSFLLLDVRGNFMASSSPFLLSMPQHALLRSISLNCLPVLLFRFFFFSSSFTWMPTKIFLLLLSFCPLSQPLLPSISKNLVPEARTASRPPVSLSISQIRVNRLREVLFLLPELLFIPVVLRAENQLRGAKWEAGEE